jgi:DnaJ-class molecular chaperone
MMRSMRCEACKGEGWLRREIDTSLMYGKPHKSTVTRPCTVCQGKGTVKVILVPSGKDRAANGLEEKELSLYC